MIINVALILLVALLVKCCYGTALMMVLYGVIGVSVVLGLLFFFGTTIGVLRFPDFYTRMHAAGKGDTLSSILILFGAALYVLTTDHIQISNVLVGIKLLVIMNFIFIGSPTATHAMMDAGYETGVAHWKKGDRT